MSVDGKPYQTGLKEKKSRGQHLALYYNIDMNLLAFIFFTFFLQNSPDGWCGPFGSDSQVL